MALGGPAHGIANITVRRVGWWVGRVGLLGLLGLGCPSKSRNLYVPLPVAQPCHIQLRFNDCRPATRLIDLQSVTRKSLVIV